MHNRVPPDRTGRLICGWTEDAARNNRAFLLSVDPLGLAGDLCYAVTLTLAQTPATSAEWAAFIHRFLVTMRRAGGGPVSLGHGMDTARSPPSSRDPFLGGA